MGVKSGGNSSFYLQESGAFDCTAAGGGPGLRSYMVLDAREVFPNGGGIVRMLP